MLCLSHAGVVRSGRHLVRDVSFDLKPGVLSVLLGANGAGKSSVIKLLSGEWSPDHGNVWWNNRAMDSMPLAERARRRAVISQHPFVAFGFSVVDCVLLGRLPYHRHPGGNDYDIVFQALRKVGMEHAANRTVNTLSGGERQRVYMARAMVQLHEAHAVGEGILLMDEPTAHMDMGHQQHLLELARQLTREGMTVLAVLHDINAAVRFADEILLMHEGRLMAAGLPDLVLRKSWLDLAYGISFHDLACPNTSHTFFIPEITTTIS